jgi:hypothetical protein
MDRRFPKTAKLILEVLVQRRQNLFGVPVDLHSGKNLFDFAVLVYDKRRPLYTHVLAAVHALFFPYAVGFRRLMLVIGKQRERKIEFRLEAGLGGVGIG